MNSYLTFVLRRILQSLPTLFVVITFSFFMIRLAPGGPFDLERKLPQAVMENLRAYYNLDVPLYQQYFDYLVGIFTGGFGTIL